MKKQKRGFTLLAVAAAIVLLVTAISMSVSDGDEGFLSSTIQVLTKPARTAMSHVADALEHVYGSMFEYDMLLEENRQLKQQIAELEQDVRDARDVLDENERLRSLMNMSQRYSNYEYENAKIIAWSVSGFSSSFTINKGSSDGLSLNECVITETGCLVGCITSLTPTTATVTTILDTGSGVGALVYETGDTGVALGSFSYMNQGLLTLDFIEEGAELLNGYTLVTSGNSGLYPPDLVIGTITDFVTGTSGLDSYAVVEPAADIGDLSSVYVITAFSVEE